MAAAQRRYWDSATFIAWLANETIDDRVSQCEPVVRAAERGEVKIVTSSLTLVEVIKLKGRAAFEAEKEESIRRFFMHEYLIVRQLDRRLAEEARALIWEHGFMPKDAVHVATALDTKVYQLDTFDEPLWKKSGVIGDPPLRIGKPYIPASAVLVADDGVPIDQL